MIDDLQAPIVRQCTIEEYEQRLRRALHTRRTHGLGYGMESELVLLSVLVSEYCHLLGRQQWWMRLGYRFGRRSVIRL